MNLSPKATFLFQGDSITDCGRSHDNDRNLGTGYVMMVEKSFSVKHPEKNVSFINRGINGNKVNGLKKRWQKDCLILRPDVITILIGVNDISKVFFWEKTTSNKSFEKDYRTILEQTRNNINAKIVLMEPFILNINRNRLKLRKKLFHKIEIVRKLAAEFDVALVPLSTIFQEAEKVKEPTFWSNDGVHPTMEGHKLIAESWTRAVADSLGFR
jgi:lysophospholipase L1-like esterase